MGRVGNVWIGEVLECDTDRVHVHLGVLGPDDQGETSVWAKMVVPMAAKKAGVAFLPKEGARVLVMFAENEVPYIVGSLWSGEIPSPTDSFRTTTNTRTIRGESGVQVVFDDTKGNEKIILCSANGQNRVVLDSSSGQVDILAGAGDIELAAPSGAVHLTAKKDVSFSALTTATVSASKTATLKGKAEVKITSSALASAAGGLSVVTSLPNAKTGSSGAGKAVIGDRIDGDEGDGLSYTDGTGQTAVSGSGSTSGDGAQQNGEAGSDTETKAGGAGQLTGADENTIGSIAGELEPTITPEMAVNPVARAVSSALLQTANSKTPPANVVVRDGQTGEIVETAPVTVGEVGPTADVSPREGTSVVQVTDKDGAILAENSVRGTANPPASYRASTPSSQGLDPQSGVPDSAAAEESKRGIPRSYLDAGDRMIDGDFSDGKAAALGAATGVAGVGAVVSAHDDVQGEKRAMESKVRGADERVQSEAKEKLKDRSGVSAVEDKADEARGRQREAENRVERKADDVKRDVDVEARAAREKQDAERDVRRSVVDEKPDIRDPQEVRQGEESLREGKRDVRRAKSDVKGQAAEAVGAPDVPDSPDAGKEVRSRVEHQEREARRSGQDLENEVGADVPGKEDIKPDVPENQREARDDLKDLLDDE